MDEVLIESLENEIKFLIKNGFWVPSDDIKELVSEPKKHRKEVVKYIRDNGFGIAGLQVYRRLISLFDEIYAESIAEKYINED